MALPPLRSPLWETARRGGSLLLTLCLLVLAGCAGHKSSHSNADDSDPSVRYVYVTNEGSDTVAMFEAGDEIVPAASSRRLSFFGTVPTGHGPRGLATGGFGLSPFGRLVVANTGDDTLSVYKIYTSGALELLSTVPTGSRPIAVSIPDPDDAKGIVNVLCAGSQQVIEYTFTADSLAEVGRAATATGPTAILSGKLTGQYVGESSGIYVAVSNGGSSSVSLYTETASGISPASPATVPVGDVPTAMGFDYGVFNVRKQPKTISGLFVLNDAGPTVSVLAGDITHFGPKSTSNVAAGARGLTFNPSPFAINSEVYSPQFFIGNDTLHTLDGYSIDTTTGAIAKVPGAKPPTGSGTTNALATISSTYRLILATNSAGSLRVYDPGVNPAGVSSLRQTLDTNGQNPYGIAVAIVDVKYVAPVAFGIGKNVFPDGTVGTAYESGTSYANGRTGPKPTVTVASGTLPPGLAVSAGTGTLPEIVLSGTPTAPGTYVFSLKATLFEESATQSYTVTIGGGSTGGGATARFFNLDTRAGHDALSLMVSGSTFPVTAFGAATAAESIVPAGQTTFSLYDAGGALVESGSSFLGVTGTRFYLIANVTGFAAGQIPPGEPAAGKSEVVVQGGADILTTQNVDVLDGSGTSVAHDSYNAAGSVRLQVAPGTYTVRVSNASTGATIATTAAFTVAANHTELVGTTSDSVGGNPQALAFAYD